MTAVVEVATRAMYGPNCIICQGPTIPLLLCESHAFFRIYAGGTKVHQDNSYLVSGGLSHRKALSVAKLLGQEDSVRQLHTSDSY